jgi:hypothetical protein
MFRERRPRADEVYAPNSQKLPRILFERAAKYLHRILNGETPRKLGGKQARPLLTFAKWRKRNDPEAKLRWYRIYICFSLTSFTDRSRMCMVAILRDYFRSN